MIKGHFQKINLSPAPNSVPEGGWSPWLEKVKTAPYFTRLLSQLSQERKAHPGKIFPPPKKVFEAFRLTPIDEIRVVILGQDPYHGPNQAHGLAFSVPKGIPIPPSLRNIFKAVAHDLPGFQPPEHGDLTGWARQGVFLLNTTLTVREGAPRSHALMGWEPFTDAVLQALNQHPNPKLFLLWGRDAAAKAAAITQPCHRCLITSHPSPLSAHRGFLTAGHFRHAQAFLQAHYGCTIDWNAL